MIDETNIEDFGSVQINGSFGRFPSDNIDDVFGSTGRGTFHEIQQVHIRVRLLKIVHGVYTFSMVFAPPIASRFFSLRAGWVLLSNRETGGVILDDYVLFQFTEPLLVLNIDVNTALEDSVTVDYTRFVGPMLSSTVRSSFFLPLFVFTQTL